MRLIFLNRYFYPDHSATSQMLSDLAFGLAESGYDVSVITSRLRYDDSRARLPAREGRAGVEIIRVATSRFGRHALLLRAIDYLTFYLSSAVVLARVARRDDIVIAMTDPPMLSVIAALVTRIKGARLVNWLQDVFPEVAMALGAGGRLTSFVAPLLRTLRDNSLRHAAVNVAIGERMAAKLASSGVAQEKITVIPNWADTEAIAPAPKKNSALRVQWGLQDAFVVAYSGNLGRAHDIDTLLGAIARTAPRKGIEEEAVATPIRWVFIGGGAHYDRLRREAARIGASRVAFHPYQPRKRLADSLAAADVHIVSLKPELEGLIVPSKFYGIAAAGRPTIFIGSPAGEIASVIARHGCGYVVPIGDSDALCEIVSRLSASPSECQCTGERARAMCVQSFSKAAAIEAWQTLLQGLAQARSEQASESYRFTPPTASSHEPSHEPAGSGYP
jgi:colanic acid biosynthesis glycosyl transferase WcaI